MQSTVKFSITRRRAASPSERASPGSALKLANSGGNGGGFVFHQQAGPAMLDDFRQAAHFAGHHRNAGRHGQQCARSQAFTVRDV